MADRDDTELSALLKSQATYHKLPPTLETRIVAALNQATPPKTRYRTGSFWNSWQHALGLGAAFAAGVLLSLGVLYRPALQTTDDGLAQEVAASHVRSLMVAHLSDVTSTDQHTVKPWFSGKLDYAPPVHDLAADGFPLAGGRLDYIDHRPVAALVYHRHQHTINLFVWPASVADSRETRLLTQQGFNLLTWSQSGMQFWAASDLSVAELQTFAELLRKSEGVAVSGPKKSQYTS